MPRNNQKSKLNALTNEQREQLIFWLCIERLTYAEAVLRLREKFGVKSSRTALCKFWARECEPYLKRQHTLKGAFLEIIVRVRQGENVIGQTEFSVALNTAAGNVTKEVQINPEVGR